MIAKLVVYKCRNCESQNIVKNGHNASGSQQYVCRDCGKRGVLEPKRGYSEAQREQILSAYQERSSMRGVQRTFGVSRPTLASWLKKRRKQSEDWRDAFACRTWRCVGSRWNVVIGVWKMEQTLALDSDVSADTPNRSVCPWWSQWDDLPQMWEQIPQTYRACQSYSDFWEAYQLVFPAETHECVGKGSGQTNHMERWYNTLRQSCARFVRKTLSFSKSDAMHQIVTRLFIIRHNLSLIT